MEKKIYTPREAWELLGIGRTRFYQLMKEKRIKYFKNGRCYLIPESAIAKATPHSCQNTKSMVK